METTRITGETCVASGITSALLNSWTLPSLLANVSKLGDELCHVSLPGPRKTYETVLMARGKELVVVNECPDADVRH